VDLPIARISAHARREKSIRHSHISTLHLWWARRPLAACRAVICASLWPDPADELCPPKFRNDAFRILENLRKRALEGGISPDQRTAFEPVSRINFPMDGNDYSGLRRSLLDFIAEFANWDLSTNKLFLETSRNLTQSAHEGLSGDPGTRPLVVDPFAGGGAIPLETLRIGADAFASDLNPVASIINKVLLEHIPNCSEQLSDELNRWGKWVKEQAEKKLRKFYPEDADGSVPITYIWARTIVCEGPGCGATVPLIRSLWMSKRGRQSVALKLVPNPNQKRVDFEVISNISAKEVSDGTVRRGSVTCPLCGYTTPVASVRRQLNKNRGGAADAQLCCVVTTRPSQQGRFYRSPTPRDLSVVTAFHDWVAQRPQCLNQPRISDGHTARNATPSAS
jgi:adenine-specific DNA methylase